MAGIWLYSGAIAICIYAHPLVSLLEGLYSHYRLYQLMLISFDYVEGGVAMATMK